MDDAKYNIAEQNAIGLSNMLDTISGFSGPELAYLVDVLRRQRGSDSLQAAVVTAIEGWAAANK